MILHNGKLNLKYWNLEMTEVKNLAEKQKIDNPVTLI